jgi:hypothetical protein
LHASVNGLLVGPAAELFANPSFAERDAADLLDNKIVEGGGDGQPTPGVPYLEVLDLPSVSEVPVSFASWGALGGLAGLLLGIAIARARRPAPHSGPA